MLDFTRRLTLGSAVNHLARRAIGRQRPVVLQMRAGPKFELRPTALDNNDYGVAYEVFVHDLYAHKGRLKSGDVKLVVDLGANVGYSILYFLHEYRICRIIAFEPHPARAAQIDRNLDLDGSHHRVELYVKAAGAKNQLMRLTDAKSSSSLTDRIAANTVPVEVMDVFPILSGKRIDLLKMDIEGGEYEILGDERFPVLDIGAVVMEWHSRGHGTEDKCWCEERLRSLGFVVDEIFAEASHGMFWARR